MAGRLERVPLAGCSQLESRRALARRQRSRPFGLPPGAGLVGFGPGVAAPGPPASVATALVSAGIPGLRRGDARLWLAAPGLRPLPEPRTGGGLEAVCDARCRRAGHRAGCPGELRRLRG